MTSSLEINRPCEPGAEGLEYGPPPSRPRHPHESFIVGLGVILPATVLAATCASNLEPLLGFILKHPIESSIQLTLAWSIPFLNLFVWNAIKAKDLRKVRRQAILIGASAGLSTALACLAALLVMLRYPAVDYSGVDQSVGLMGISATFLSSTFVSICLIAKLRSFFPTSGAKLSTLVNVGLGAFIALSTLFLSEARQFCTRIAEKFAVSNKIEESSAGLSFLRTAGADATLKSDCSAPWAMDLSGLFFKFDDVARRKLYFQVTGSPYLVNGTQTALAALPDNKLGEQVVGDKMPGLSMVRSQVSGLVHPETRSATIDWTFVFKNDTFSPMEAKAEIVIPKDAVVSDMVLWINGSPKRATIGDSQNAASTYSWVVNGRKDPALVTDLGQGRMLLQCYPVQPNSEMKVKVAVSTPITIDGREGVLNLPRIAKSNFDLAGEHSIKLRSTKELRHNLEGIRHTVTRTGAHSFAGTLENLSSPQNVISFRTDLRVDNNPNAPMIVRDPYSYNGFVMQSTEPVPVERPDHLVVVIDGSRTMEGHKAEVARALATIPSAVPTSVVIANRNAPNGIENKTVAQALETLNEMKFEGGEDNLKYVARAADLAGETEGGAVLWIHGPQPAFDKELYIIAPYVQKPNFFELSIDDNYTDQSEFIKNMKEIGPFTPVARNGSLSDDLSRFVSKWQADGKDRRLVYVPLKNFVGYEQLGINKSDLQIASRELAQLYAAQKARELVRLGDRLGACDLATRYNIVTPVTSAVVFESSSDYDHGGIEQRDESEHNAQVAVGQYAVAVDGGVVSLAGATNGTIGPQGGDSTSIMGTNTAGTIRVSNLANLERSLNVFALGFEAIAIAIGGCMIAFALMKANVILPLMTTTISPRNRIALGVGLIVAGVVFPNCLAAIVATMRDLGYFS